MDRIKINFLGTSASIPTAKRNHTAILASFSNENILIDCGEGTQRQFRLADISPTKITRILITHWHGDHTFGLPGLLQTLAMAEYDKTLKIYGPRGTKHKIEIIKKIIHDFGIKTEIHEVSGQFVDEKDFTIEASQMSHGIPSNAYSITLKDKIRLKKEKLAKLKLPNSPILGKLKEGKDITHNGKKIKSSEVTYKEKGKKVTFILDTLPNKNAEKIAKNSDILITESSFSASQGKKAKDYRHLTSKDAARIAKKSKSKALILTHITEKNDKNILELEKEAKEIFKNTTIAKDFHSITI